MAPSLRWRRDVRVALAVSLLLCLATGASSDFFSVSLPPWAIELNAARDLAAVAPQQPDPVGLNDPDQDLLAWARREEHGSTRQKRDQSDRRTDVFLLVGAKTSVVHGFARRQVIRKTWASASFVPSNVRVVFLGCESDLSMYPPEQQQQLRDAIEHEKEVFGDLLTSELIDCIDSFAGLAEKVKAFLLWSATSYVSLTYAMITDDDIYLRLDRLVALLDRPTTPRKRFFGGNAASSVYRGLTTAIRDLRNKYYVSPDEYPMRDLPPFLTGAHYILSGDVVRFIARNFKDLRSIRALDDVTVGLWMFALLRTKPTWFDEFHVLRTSRSCDDDLISLADLTMAATLHIHANIAAVRRLCEGFDDLQWMKKAPGIVVPNTLGREIQGGTKTSDVFLHWDMQLDENYQRLRIQVQLVVREFSLDFVYVPAIVRAEDGFCGQASSLLQRKLYLVVGYEVCAHYSDILISAMERAVAANPPFGPILSLARHNLRRMQIDDASEQAAIAQAITTQSAFSPSPRPMFTAVLSNSTRSTRALFECLLVQMIPNHQVLVLNDHDTQEHASAAIDGYVVSRSEGTHALEKALSIATTVLVIDDAPAPLSTENVIDNARVVIFSASPDVPTNGIYLPAASRVFANTMKYTPARLLHSRGHSSDAGRAGLHVLPSCLDQPRSVHLSELLDTLNNSLPFTLLDNTVHCSSHSDFNLDVVVDKLSSALFVLVEASSNTDVSAQLLGAFLAGVIPIVIDDSVNDGVSARLFNPNALIHCKPTNEETRACVQRIQRVHASAALRNQMRHEPAMTDRRVFEQVFSWHPEVVAAMQLSEEGQQTTRMSRRLERLIASLADY